MAASPKAINGPAIAEVWARLASRSFLCTEAAFETQQAVGGRIMGYYHHDNPTAVLGTTEGGHDFLLVDGEWIIDFWAAAYYGECPIHHLTDNATRRLYGDPQLWEDVEERSAHEPRFLDD